jgi:hypothetical protein
MQAKYKIVLLLDSMVQKVNNETLNFNVNRNIIVPHKPRFPN